MKEMNLRPKMSGVVVGMWDVVVSTLFAGVRRSESLDSVVVGREITCDENIRRKITNLKQFGDIFSDYIWIHIKTRDDG